LIVHLLVHRTKYKTAMYSYNMQYVLFELLPAIRSNKLSHLASVTSC